MGDSFVATGTGTDDSGSTESTNFMLDCYDNYLGDLEVADRRVVHLGFGLLMAGVVSVVAGWVIYLWSQTAGPAMMSTTRPFWALRKAAITAAGVGLPLVFAGGAILLLADRRVSKGQLRNANRAGVALCLLGVGLFVFSYPQAWDVAGLDYSLPGLTVYGVGLAVLMMTVGAGIGCRCSVSTPAAD